jgi:CubicO group peptidase (beta-lactamase class C family)
MTVRNALPVRLFLTVALLLSVACSSSETKSTAAGPDQVLHAAVEAGKVAGVVAAAASPEGVIHQGVFGKKSAESGEPMRADTIFRIASMTKPATSVAVMQLVEQGKVSLGESIGAYLPELKNPKVIEGFGSDGKPRLRAATRPPTIRELLSHTSGYAYSNWNEDMGRYESSVELPGGRERLWKLPMTADPGSRWQYSASTDILGVLVESGSGLTLEEYFAKNIFQPLGMRDTSFQVPASKWSRVAVTSQREADGSLTPRPLPETPPQVTFFSGGGGLFSTAPDYIRFLQALLNGGHLDGVELLKPETVALMAQNQIGDLEAGTMTSFRPETSANVNFFPNSKDKFGLGFLINTQPVEGGRAAGSLAWGGIANTYFWIDREKNVCGVLLTQVLPFADPTVLALLEEYEKAVYANIR